MPGIFAGDTAARSTAWRWTRVSVPNAPVDRSGRGCSFCSAAGSRAPYLGDAFAPGECHDRERSLKGQVDGTIAFLKRRYAAEAFILYFQPYSNTNAPVDELEADVRQRSRAGRLPRTECRHAARLHRRREGAPAGVVSGTGLEVWVELGLQTIHDVTLRRIGRGHTAEDFRRAYGVLKEEGLKVAVHLIFGLPGEESAQILQTMEAVARLGSDGVKIHNLHVPRGTPLEAEFCKGEVTVPSAGRHLEYAIAAIERLPPRNGDHETGVRHAPGRARGAAGILAEGNAFISRLAAEMRARGSFQGRLFGPLDRASGVGLPLVQEA